MAQHESSLTRALITKPLEKHFGRSIYIEKLHGGPMKRGIPDTMFTLGGIGGLIEVKKWDNPEPHPTDLQWSHLRRLHNAGGLGLWILIRKDRSLELHHQRPLTGNQRRGLDLLCEALSPARVVGDR